DSELLPSEASDVLSVTTVLHAPLPAPQTRRAIATLSIALLELLPDGARVMTALQCADDRLRAKRFAPLPAVPIVCRHAPGDDDVGAGVEDIAARDHAALTRVLCVDDQVRRDRGVVAGSAFLHGLAGGP